MIHYMTYPALLPCIAICCFVLLLQSMYSSMCFVDLQDEYFYLFCKIDVGTLFVIYLEWTMITSVEYILDSVATY